MFVSVFVAALVSSDLVFPVQIPLHLAVSLSLAVSFSPFKGGMDTYQHISSFYVYQ